MIDILKTFFIFAAENIVERFGQLATTLKNAKLGE